MIVQIPLFLRRRFLRDDMHPQIAKDYDVVVTKRFNATILRYIHHDVPRGLKQVPTQGLVETIAPRGRASSLQSTSIERIDFLRME
jgi:hypothetical protein